MDRARSVTQRRHRRCARPLRTAMISAQIDTAVSSGVRAADV